MKKNVTKLSLILMLAFLLIVSLAACTAQQTVTEREEIKVSRSDIVQSVNADGNLSLSQQRKLSFGTSGKIEQVNVAEGDKVSAGKVLARLETGSLERAVNTAELAIKSAEIDLQQTEYTITAAEIDLEQATDNFRKITYPYTYSTFAFDVPRAVDSISNAARQVADAQKVLQIGLTTDQYAEASRQLRQALDNLAVARESLARGTGADVFTEQLIPVKDFWTLRTAQLQMEKAQSALDGAKNAVSKAQLALDKAKYDRDTAKDMLDKAVITAPFDGIIAQVNVKAGETLTSVDYTKVIFELVDLTHMELKIDVDEIDIPSVKIGQEANINIDAVPSAGLKGQVIFISPVSKVESGVVLYEVKIGFDVPDGSAFRDGMSASADIVIAQRSNALLLPTRAIMTSSSGEPTVKLLIDGQVQERTVVAGISDSFNTEIVSGLNEGDTVVIERQVKTGTSGFFGG